VPKVPKAAIRAAETVSVPEPWNAIGPLEIKELAAVGFGPDNEYFVVVSSNGYGVHGCTTGERIEWAEGPVPFDTNKYTVPGIGPLAGKDIIVSGRGGGLMSARILPYGSADKWAAATVKMPESEDTGIFLRSPPGYQGEVWSLISRQLEMRAIGFSPGGTSFIVALPDTLTLLVRG